MNDRKKSTDKTKAASRAVKSAARKPAGKAAGKPAASTPRSDFDATRRMTHRVVTIAGDFTSVDVEVLAARPGDLVEWRSASGENFYVRFKGSKAESADDNGRRSIPAHAGRVLMVVRERKKGEGKPELKYDIVSEKGTLDPKVIIDPMAQ